MADPDGSSIVRAIRELLSALVAAAPSREEARRLVAELRAVIEALEDALPAAEQAPEPEPEAPLPRPTRTVVRELWGRKVVVPDTGAAAPARAPRPRAAPPTERHRLPRHDLDLVLSRTRIKAEACRLLLERRRREAAGETIDAEEETERRRELQKRARALRDGYVWPLDPLHAVPAADDLELLATGYQNLALALALARAAEAAAPPGAAPTEEVLSALAEAQSAVFVALARVGIERDADQVAAFSWLREQTREHRIFLPRYMSLERTADPARHADLRARLLELEERLARERGEERERAETARRLRRELERLDGGDGATARDAWRRIANLLEGWVAAGLSPAAREVCEPLLERLDDLPDDLPAASGAASVLRAARELRSRRTPAGGEPRPPATEEVLRARELLRDKVAVLVGGEERPESRARLEVELGLAELRWISTRSHRSLEPLVQRIARPEVDLVLVAIRWSDHAFEDLQHAAERLGKVFVRLPAGYGVNRVAHDVVEQASEQLARVAAPRDETA